jgi:sulfur dioxygenase
MLLKQLFDQDTWTYTYLLADPESREAVIIDPVVERVDRDLKLIAELGLELVYTLDTHVHADHVTGSGELRNRTGALSGVASVAEVACVDRNLIHGDVLRFGRYALEVRSTPGHTNGCLTFVVETSGQTLAFTGDALFIRGCGRTDFQQGDAATLYSSVHGQIFSLPEDTIVYPGHDYRGHTMSTVAEEKAHNPRLNIDITEVDFVEIMDGLNLAHPKRIHEALPANLACGLAPHDDADKAADSVVKELPANRLEDLYVGLVIDVRTHEEFEGELGHLPDAVLAPLSELRQQAAAWPRDVPVLVICRSGKRSSQGCSLLSEMGFTDVTNLMGGMMAWRDQQGVAQ